MKRTQHWPPRAARKRKGSVPITAILAHGPADREPRGWQAPLPCPSRRFSLLLMLVFTSGLLNSIAWLWGSAWSEAQAPLSSLSPRLAKGTGHCRPELVLPAQPQASLGSRAHWPPARPAVDTLAEHPLSPHEGLLSGCSARGSPLSILPDRSAPSTFARRGGRRGRLLQCCDSETRSSTSALEAEAVSWLLQPGAHLLLHGEVPDRKAGHAEPEPASVLSPPKALFPPAFSMVTTMRQAGAVLLYAWSHSWTPGRPSPWRGEKSRAGSCDNQESIPVPTAVKY